MRCSLRQLTCAVKILLLLCIPAPAGFLDDGHLKEIIRKEVHRTFGNRVKLCPEK